ncbi:MAG: hypothetical protein LBV07_05760 [Syntrophobacterales bacterium]|jgi:dolichol kinase|nr:hypothetical protein [Syntrophobacterales bacterium]
MTDKKTEEEIKYFQGTRKLFHVFASSFVPLVYWFSPYFTQQQTKTGLLILLSCCFIILFIMDIIRFISPPINLFLMKRFSLLIRQTETRRFTGATFMCLSFLLTIFFFSREIAVTAMLFISLGDTAAEIAGKHWGRRKFHGRSLEGMAGFFLLSLPAAWLILEDWRVAVLGAAMGALIEFFSFRVDDNLSVPFLSALSIWFILHFF